MDRVFKISPTLVVTIKEKRQRLYLDLSDGKSRFFISVKTWSENQWMTQVDDSIGEIPVGYLKYGSKQSGGFIQLDNRGMSKSRFLS